MNSFKKILLFFGFALAMCLILVPQKVYAATLYIDSPAAHGNYIYNIGDIIQVSGRYYPSSGSSIARGTYSVVKLDTSATVKSGSFSPIFYRFGLYTSSLTPGNYGVFIEAADSSGISLSSYFTFQLRQASNTITYYLNGGSFSSSPKYSYEKGSIYTLPTPTRSGYTFAGWYPSSIFSGSRIYSISASDEGAKTYYAKWHSNANYITSMYKSTGTWSYTWKKTRTYNKLKISRKKGRVTLKPNISSHAKVYFKYSGGSWSNLTGKSKTVYLKRGQSKTVYFKVYSQSNHSRTYKFVLSRSR